jgi:hypothetical protein
VEEKALVKIPQPLVMPRISPLKLQKVVVVNKMTRFQHEAELHGNTG